MCIIWMFSNTFNKVNRALDKIVIMHQFSKRRKRQNTAFLRKANANTKKTKTPYNAEYGVLEEK